MTKGTVAEIRDRMFRVLKGCQVEMLIIDEADRLKPKTFAEVRDIFDKLDIAVVLVGTDRLDAVIKRDEPVYNRFRACHRFGKLSGEDFAEAIAIWERDVLKLPVASNLEALAKVVGAETDRLMEMLPPFEGKPPNGVGMKLSPIRLCAACYLENPCHQMEWQFKQTDRCFKHSLRLLSECPNCKTRFQIPALWVDGWCMRCFLPFVEMKHFQRAI
jgi:hypothetical protein